MTTCLRTIKKTKDCEEKYEEKAASGVENTPTEEEGWPSIVGNNQARPTIHDSSSNTLLSQEEILAIKRKNLTEALRRLQKLRKPSTETRSFNYYDASLGYVSEC